MTAALQFFLTYTPVISNFFAMGDGMAGVQWARAFVSMVIVYIVVEIEKVNRAWRVMHALRRRQRRIATPVLRSRTAICFVRRMLVGSDVGMQNTRARRSRSPAAARRTPAS